MDSNDKLSVDANTTGRMKFVRPTIDLTGSMPSSAFVSRLTVTSVADFGKTLSPVDILKRVSREFRKVNEPEDKGKSCTAVDRGIKRVAYPNTELTMRTRKSLFNLADKFLDTIFDKSLKRVNRKPKLSQASAQARRDAELRRLLFPNLATIHIVNELVYLSAVNFVDSIIEECDRRLFSAEAHGIDRLKTYRSPEEFTIGDGVELVLRCVGRWVVNRHWCVKVAYAGRNVSDERHLYYYTARLSVPTLTYPVAQVTADVYFTVDVLAMGPPPVHVDVWYRVETDRSRHSALADTFHEEWIDSVVRRKLAAFKMFKF